MDRHPPRRRPLKDRGPRQPLAFILRFAGVWGLGLVLLGFFPAVERWAISATVASLDGAFAAIGIPCQAIGSDVQVGNALPVTIIPDCTPLLPTLTFWAAVAAFPSPWRWKLAGFAGGALLLWIFNLLRIALLVAVSGNPVIFSFTHIYLWQTATLVVVCVLFGLWLWLPSRRVAQA